MAGLTEFQQGMVADITSSDYTLTDWEENFIINMEDQTYFLTDGQAKSLGEIHEKAMECD